MRVIDFRRQPEGVRLMPRLLFAGIGVLIVAFSACHLPAQACHVQAKDGGVPGVLLQSTTVDTNKIQRYEQYALTHDGDPGRGRQLFLDEKVTKCVICHKVNGQGADVGPDLSAIGGKFARPHLIESLLEPSRQIVEGYRTSVIVTVDGRVQNGIVKTRSDTSIMLADVDGKTHEIAVADIEEREETSLSLMPEGLMDDLTPAQFTDIIAYLETLRPGGKPTPGAGITGPIKLPEGFEVKIIARGLTGCAALETTSDGRVLICEQTGTLRVVKHNHLLEEPALTLAVDDYWERGLIGVTVHPDFPTTPYIYVCYVAKEPYPHHRVSRFTLRGDVAEPGSETILLRGDDQTKLGGKVPAGHQGGALHFGLDGKLYIAIGEQTAAEPSQHLDSFLGKILRINPDGTIPEDNPFYQQAKGKYRAIWALGFRNPFTFAIRPSNGDMLINDIGGEFEEVNRGIAGANYGWPAVDHGPTNDPRFHGPVYFYQHASACGADFSPENLPWPNKYRGKYVFGEYILGWIKILDPEKPDEVDTFLTGLRNAVDLRFATDGSLYVLVRNAWVIDDKFQPNTGTLLQIRYTGNQAAAAKKIAVEGK